MKKVEKLTCEKAVFSTLGKNGFWTQAPAPKNAETCGTWEIKHVERPAYTCNNVVHEPRACSACYAVEKREVLSAVEYESLYNIAFSGFYARTKARTRKWSVPKQLNKNDSIILQFTAKRSIDISHVIAHEEAIEACGGFVYQNGKDLFWKNLPAGKIKTALMILENDFGATSAEIMVIRYGNKRRIGKAEIK